METPIEYYDNESDYTTKKKYFENGNIQSIKEYHKGKEHAFGYTIEDNIFKPKAAYTYYGRSGKENKLFFIYGKPISEQKYIKYLSIFRRKAALTRRNKQTHIFSVMKETHFSNNGLDLCDLITKFV
jgi:hypothetical protein